VRRGKENCKRENDGERRERPQAESIDDHRRVLPLPRQLGPLVVRSHLPRQRPQLAEDRLEGHVGPAGARRRRLHAFLARPDRRRRLLVFARRSTAAAVVVDRML